MPVGSLIALHKFLDNVVYLSLSRCIISEQEKKIQAIGFRHPIFLPTAVTSSPPRLGDSHSKFT